MKGAGWIVMLLGLLGVAYLLTRDLSLLGGEREGRVVVEPLQRAVEAGEAVQKARRQLVQGIDRADQ